MRYSGGSDPDTAGAGLATRFLMLLSAAPAFYLIKALKAKEILSAVENQPGFSVFTLRYLRPRLLADIVQ